MLNKIRHTKHQEIIGIDHNFDYLEMYSCKPSSDLLHLHLAAITFPTFIKPTRITLPSLITYMYVTQPHLYILTYHLVTYLITCLHSVSLPFNTIQWVLDIQTQTGVRPFQWTYKIIYTPRNWLDVFTPVRYWWRLQVIH